jgi:GNAT superfamily N-acetyltransferase
VAQTYWGWLVVDVLAVVDAARGSGIGTQLVDTAEIEARHRGCTRAHTIAYEFQGLGFWVHRGYRIVGELAGYPPGHSSHWLQRDL